MLLMYRSLTGLGLSRSHILRLVRKGDIKARKNARDKWIIDFEEYDYVRQVMEMPVISDFIEDYTSSLYQSINDLCNSGVINAKVIFGRYRLYEDGVKTLIRYIDGIKVSDLAKELGKTHQCIGRATREYTHSSKIGGNTIISKDDADFIRSFYEAKSIARFVEDSGLYRKKVERMIANSELDTIKMGKTIKIKGYAV